MGIATAVASGVGTVGKIVEAEKTKDDIRHARVEQESGQEDLSQRREATYRGSRMALQGAIEDFYKQKGWKTPEPLPGAFTTRALPGEAPLYPEAGATTTKLPEVASVDDSDAGQIASSIGRGAPSDVGQVDIQPVARPVAGMQNTMGVVPQASTSIPITPVARAPFLGNPIGQVAPVALKTDDYAPIYIPNRSYGINKILPLLSK